MQPAQQTQTTAQHSEEKLTLSPKPNLYQPHLMPNEVPSSTRTNNTTRDSVQNQTPKVQLCCHDHNDQSHPIEEKTRTVSSNSSDLAPTSEKCEASSPSTITTSKEKGPSQTMSASQQDISDG